MSPGSSSPSSPQPDGFTKQRVYLKLSSPFPPGQRPGPAPCCSSSVPGSSPAPTRSQRLVPPVKGPLARVGHPGLPAAPPNCIWAEAPQRRAARADPDWGNSSPLPQGKGTGSLSQSPGNRLFTPQGGRREGTPPSAAPPSSCHHSPALQGLTFEFVICFGLLVKLLPDFEIRHDPRLRLHVSSCLSLHCLEVRAEPGGGGEVAGLGPASVRPAQCLAQPAARAAAPAPGVHTRPGREGPRPALPGIVVRPGGAFPACPGSDSCENYDSQKAKRGQRQRGGHRQGNSSLDSLSMSAAPLSLLTSRVQTWPLNINKAGLSLLSYRHPSSQLGRLKRDFKSLFKKQKNIEQFGTGKFELLSLP